MPKTCIIIPCYNEAARLDKTAFLDFLSVTGDIFICFGNDGSTDTTLASLQTVQNVYSDKVFIVNREKNCGKASIVRDCANEMHKKNMFDYIGYFDADLSTQLDAVHSFVDFFAMHPRCGIIFGSRIENGSAVIKKTNFRHYTGRIFSFIINKVFSINLYDTQCGAKLLRQHTIPFLFDRPFVSRWLFDIEILLRARQQKDFEQQFIAEKPLALWVNKPGSKIRLVDLLLLPVQIVKMKFKYW